ncbi:MAG: 4-amino-4-deoxychorismate lyase, partial [Roseovarius sp.]
MEDPLRPPPDPGFRLIETCRWMPGEGIAFRARHLARLERSAARLGIVPQGAGPALDGVAGEGPLRVRLTCDRQGHVAVETQPFTPLPAGTVWRYAMAHERVRAADPWRGLKTTERGLYDRARAAL